VPLRGDERRKRQGRIGVVRAVRGQAERVGPLPGPPPGVEEGDREAPAGPQDRARRGGLSVMGTRAVKPTSAARRYLTYVTYEEITKKEPEKGLLEAKRRTNGRNVYGRITVRHRGGGAKRMLRKVDFRREKFGIPARVAAIEYDPNRSARLALLHYRDGEKRYIIAPHGLKVGDTLMSGPEAEILPGNALAVRNIPVGTLIHAIELKPGKGAQLCRSAGAQAQLLAK